MIRPKENKGILLVLMTAFISGVAIFINKFGVSEINPYLFTGLKNALVAVFLFSLIWGTREIKTLKVLSRKNWLVLFLIGLIGGCLPFLLFFKGLSLTSPAQAAFIHKNLFIFVALLAFLFLKERIEKKFFIAAALLLTGNLFLLNKTFSFSLEEGNFLILLATFLWAIESIIAKKALESLPAKIVAFGRMFFGSFLILIFLAAFGKIGLLGNLTGVQVLWVVITSLFLLAYVTTWYSGLKQVRVSLAASILTLGAPITSLLSIFSGTWPRLEELAGIILITLGLILVIGLGKVWQTIKDLKKIVYVRT